MKGQQFQAKFKKPNTTVYRFISRVSCERNLRIFWMNEFSHAYSFKIYIFAETDGRTQVRNSAELDMDAMRP